MAFKWGSPELDSEQARQFFIRHLGQMHAPDMLLAEVAGSLVRRVNDRKLRVQSAIEVVNALRLRMDEAVHLHRITPEQISLAAELAMSLGHPLKDCVYLTLADQLGCLLVTSDVRFAIGWPTRRGSGCSPSWSDACPRGVVPAQSTRMAG